MAKKQKADAKRLRELISRACLDVASFAREIGYGRRMIYYMLSGQREVPRIVMLAAEHIAECESTRHARELREGWTRQQLAESD